VLEIAANKFHGLQRDGSPAGAFWFFAAENYLPVFNSYNPAVADCHFENIGGQIFKASLAAADGLGINVPAEIPDLRINLVVKPRSYHFGFEFGLEDL